MITIRTGSIEEIDQAIAIGRRLPDFFTEDAFKKMEQDFRRDELFFVDDDYETVGFCSVKLKNEKVAEISWLGVAPDRQRKGLGLKLMHFISEKLVKLNVKILEVKTLDQSANYEPYERTRKFYQKCGFMHIETIDPFPGWGPNNPCAIYVKTL